MTERLNTLLVELGAEMAKSGYLTCVILASNTPTGQTPSVQVLAQNPLPVPPPFAMEAIRHLMPLALPEAGKQAEMVTAVAFKLAPAVIRAMSNPSRQVSVATAFQKLIAEAGLKMADVGIKFATDLFTKKP